MVVVWVAVAKEVRAAVKVGSVGVVEEGEKTGRPRPAAGRCGNWSGFRGTERE